MASPAFERFRFSFFEDADSARDGLDTMVLADLQGDERAQAEDMLIAYLPDSRGVIGLGVLKARRAEPELAQLFEAEQRAWLDAKLASDGFCPSDGLIYLAKALWQIRPDARWLAAMVDVVGSGAEWTQRITAAEALYDVRDPTAVGALIQALDDAEALVRYHAARGLLAIHGLPAESNDREHMIYRVMSDDTGRRESGKRDILAAINGRPVLRPEQA